jgi:hypothetical protein
MRPAWGCRHHRTGEKPHFQSIVAAMGIHPVRPQSAHATAIRTPFAVNRALTSAAGNGGLNR